LEANEPDFEIQPLRLENWAVGAESAGGTPRKFMGPPPAAAGDDE